MNMNGRKEETFHAFRSVSESTFKFPSPPRLHLFSSHAAGSPQTHSNQQPDELGRDGQSLPQLLRASLAFSCNQRGTVRERQIEGWGGSEKGWKTAKMDLHMNVS